MVQVDVVQYYTEETARLEKEVDRLREESLASPIGVAFVTFDDIESSKTVYDDHKSSYLSCFKSKPQHSSLSDSLKPNEWKVSFASTPRDVKWVNLQESQLSDYLALALFYIGVLWLGLFFTTPEQITENISRFLSNVIFDFKTIPHWISALIPSLILMIFASVMPSLISCSVRKLHRYIYKSTVSYLILRNTFWFLLVVVIIFPTFSLSTIWPLMANFCKLLYDSNEVIDVRWNCFFHPDTSAFYVYYVMSAALISTGMELVRLPEFAL